MRARCLAASLAFVAVASACAQKTAPAPVATAPHFPDFVQPTAPAPQAGSPMARQNERAWQFLQSGDLRGAEREAAVALKAQPAFYPAQVTLAYIALARKDGKRAVVQFAKIVEARADYAPAWVGKGLAHLAEEQVTEAAEAFRAALKIDPSLVDIARRVEVLTLRGLQEELTAARQAARDGQPEAAMRAFRNAIAASPDSAFLYHELAVIERQQGQVQQAIEHARRAITLDPSDAAALVIVGDLLEQQGDLPGAVAAYSESLALDADRAVEAKVAALRGRLEFEALPEQYRAIQNNAQITRADLAALIAVRLPAILQSAQVKEIGVLTDVRGHWAERYIAPVGRAGIVEAFPNHTFQPRAVVRRVDLAQAVARLLTLVAAAQPARGQAWIGARGRFSDLQPAHLAYPAASMAVAAGIMEPTPEGAFQPARAVTGAEASSTIERIRAIAAPAAGSASERR